MCRTLKEEALSLGFDAAQELDVGTLKPLEWVRSECAEDRCRSYGRNWTCPPLIGTLEECSRRMQAFHRGLLVQTVGKLQKDVDARGIQETERRHLANFRRLTALIRQKHPEALCLGAGGCRICESCAYPEPCRFPELAYSSMEGYGLFVTRVCRDNGLAYYYGPRTISYTSCVLYDAEGEAPGDGA